jgi:hypothetical protein
MQNIDMYKHSEKQTGPTKWTTCLSQTQEVAGSAEVNAANTTSPAMVVVLAVEVVTWEAVSKQI